MPADPVLKVQPLASPWPTIDPFLLCGHLDNTYPRGNARLGIDAPALAGRDIGQDFSRKDGWSMYHGETVPGFPGHPHRGFETVTIVREGLIDHADSLGAAARYGNGDVQWLTTGSGIAHAEMFPLLDPQAPNRLELFQIWLNLPARSKMAAPNFTMFWSEDIPRLRSLDAQGRETELTCIAGRLPLDASLSAGAGELQPLAPPPDSWAAQADADLAIWTVRMAPGANWTLPAAAGRGTRRMLYFFEGSTVRVGGRAIEGHAAIELDASVDVELVNGEAAGQFLVLQGRPIDEPVARYGPFVMNSQDEIMQAMADYRRTQFGGWPWPDGAPVHGRETSRFARHPDGKEERPAAAQQPA